MKIAQVVCRFKPYKGGISNVAYDYALGMSKLGHEVTIFTPLYNDKDNEVVFPEFKVVRLKPKFKIGNAGYIPQLADLLEGFDIVNLHYPFFGGAEVVYKVKKDHPDQFKLVINYQMDVLGKGWKKFVFRLHSRYLMPKIVKAADKVIVSSLDYAANSNIKEIYENQSEKFVAIPPGVDLRKFYPTAKDTELLQKFNIKPEEKVLLLVGGLDKAHYFKGLDFLIESYKGFELKNLKILIVGSGDCQSYYQKKVLNLGLIDRILFSGPVSDSNLPKYFNLADVTILPSIDRSEAFGIVLIESMACAKPVIAANLAGVRSVFENNLSGLSFEILNREDLARQVRKLFTDDVLRQKMGQAARERAIKLYDQEELIKTLEYQYNLM